jgi:hypothetical protein
VASAIRPSELRQPSFQGACCHRDDDLERLASSTLTGFSTAYLFFCFERKDGKIEYNVFNKAKYILFASIAAKATA